ncbi:hypothetical protein MMPV_000039 [Pyropia vietnamensis]
MAAEAGVDPDAPPQSAAVATAPAAVVAGVGAGVPNPKDGAADPLLLGREREELGGGSDGSDVPSPVGVVASSGGDAVLAVDGSDGGSVLSAGPNSRRSVGGGAVANGGSNHSGGSSNDVSVLVERPPADGSTAAVLITSPSTGSIGMEPPNVRDDVLCTLGWVAAAGVVAAALAAGLGAERGLEFVAAYVVEYSLSVDNLLVFLLLFQHFQVPRRLQARVLKWGIIGAMSLRGVMIVAGEALTRRFRWVSLLFGCILLVSAAKMLFSSGGEEEDVANNATVRFVRRLLPVSDTYDGDRFFTVVHVGSTGTGGEGGSGVNAGSSGGLPPLTRRLATPLMLVLLSVELSDVVFALDSVPAVLGISDHTFVIYSSNMMAVLGLRSLFFVISEAIGDLRFLQPALAIVLAFVGIKMMAGVAGFEVGILPSLGVIAVTVGVGVGASLLFPEVEKTDEADKKA